MTHVCLICSPGESSLQDLQDQWRTGITGVPAVLSSRLWHITVVLQLVLTSRASCVSLRVIC